MKPRRIAVIGAECTGKTVLARALAADLGGTVVPEELRSFVAAHGRAPTAPEQRGVMRAQIAAEDAAAGDPVISDSGALMTAVYSLLYYGDGSLADEAAAHHRSAYAVTVWCGTDVPWVADQGQRDGPEFRARADRIIAELIGQHELRALPVSGPVARRLAAVRRQLSIGV